MTLACDTPVNSVSLVFATNGPGPLSFISPSGNTSVISSFQGGLFPGISRTLRYSAMPPCVGSGYIPVDDPLRRDHVAQIGHVHLGDIVERYVRKM